MEMRNKDREKAIVKAGRIGRLDTILESLKHYKNYYNYSKSKNIMMAINAIIDEINYYA